MQVPGPATIRRGGDPAVLIAIDDVARDAAARGITVRLASLAHPRPLGALLDVLRAEAIGLCVFGPDRRRYGRFRFRRHAARLRRDAPCLVWPDD